MPSEELQKMTERIKALEQKKRMLEHKISNQMLEKNELEDSFKKEHLLEKYLEDNESESLKDTENLLKVLAHFKHQNNDYVKRQIQTLEEKIEVHTL